MILDEKHQKVAIEIVQKNRTKKSCNKCYDRGYIGFSQDKTVIPCEKCVDIEKAYNEWKQYVSQDEVLKENYKELFDEEPKDDDSEEEKPTQTKVVTKKRETNKPSIPHMNTHPSNKTSAVRKTSGRGK